MKKQTTKFLFLLACSFFSKEMNAQQPNLIYQATPGNSYGLNSCNEFGDIDGDGDLDLIIGGYSLIEDNNATILYRNNGGTSFTLEVTLANLNDGTADFVDIDGDGDLDIFLTGKNDASQEQTRIFINDGTGAFTEDLTHGITPISYSAVDFGDVDDDGDLDLIMTGETTVASVFNAELYLNDGNGNFTLDAGTTFNPGRGGDIQFFDCDGDDDLDFIVTGGSVTTVDYNTELYINDGNGNFSIDNSLGIDDFRQGSLDIGDVDGDGDLDVLMNGRRGANVDESVLYLNDGSGSFTASAGPTFLGGPQGDVKFGDLDGDNDLDFIVQGWLLPNVVLETYLNDGNGNFTIVSPTLFIPTGARNGEISIGDMNQSGMNDVFITGYRANATNMSHLYRNFTLPCKTTSSFSVLACDSYTVPSGDETYTVNGVYKDTIPNSQGCDSLMTITVTINNSATGTDIQTVCGEFLWIDGNTYTQSTNTPTFTIPEGAENGCDSTVTLDLTILPTATGTDVQTACDEYTWIDGNTYTESNSTATFTIEDGAENGCDSIVTLDLTIYSSYSVTDVISACESYTWIDGVTYTSDNNTATHLLTSVNNCDSLVTLDLTINNSTTGTDVQTACGEFTWIDGNTYTENNNTVTFVLPNSVGCDSIVTLDLTINNSTSGTDVQTACGEFTWIDGNTYTENNSTATFVLPNSVGCDSIVTLDLTVVSVDPTVSVSNGTITANYDGGTYQWVDCANNNAEIAGEDAQSFTPTSSGNYAVIISDNDCEVTSDCEQIAVASVDHFNAKNEITVYPNPNNGEFFIDVDEAAQLEVLDVTGKVIAVSPLVTGENAVDINVNSNGLYLLKITSTQGVVTKRVIVQNQ